MEVSIQIARRSERGPALRATLWAACKEMRKMRARESENGALDIIFVQRSAKENHRENIRVYIKSDSVSRVESVFSFAPSALALAARIPPPAHLPFWHWRRRLWVLARGMVQPVAAQTQTKACGVLSHTHKQIFTCHPSYTHFLNCDCASAPTLCRSRVAIIITWRPLIFLLERRGGDVIKIAN